MARYVVEWVCRSREERDQALPFLVIGHDGTGARIAPVNLPLDEVARRVRLHPDSLRDHISDWEDKLGKPLHVYDRKSERYVPVAAEDPQWLNGACAPTLDDNYFCGEIVERPGPVEAVLADVVAELQGQFTPQLVG